MTRFGWKGSSSDLQLCGQQSQSPAQSSCSFQLWGCAPHPNPFLKENLRVRKATQPGFSSRLGNRRRHFTLARPMSQQHTPHSTFYWEGGLLRVRCFVFCMGAGREEKTRKRQLEKHWLRQGGVVGKTRPIPTRPSSPSPQLPPHFLYCSCCPECALGLDCATPTALLSSLCLSLSPVPSASR